MPKTSYGKQLTDNQFCIVDASIEATDKVRRMARAVLVEGFSAKRVSSDCDVSRQAVHRAVKRYYDAHLQRQQCPEGWEVITVALPSNDAKMVRSMEIEKRRKYAGD